MLSSDEIQAHSENTVWRALVHWHSRDTKRRRREVVGLFLDIVKFPFMQTNYLLDVVQKSQWYGSVCVCEGGGRVTAGLFFRVVCVYFLLVLLPLLPS